MIRFVQSLASFLPSAAIGAVIGAVGLLAVQWLFPDAPFGSVLASSLAVCVGLVTLQTFIYVRAMRLDKRLGYAAAACAVLGALLISYYALPFVGPVYSVHATVAVPVGASQP